MSLSAPSFACIVHAAGVCLCVLVCTCVHLCVLVCVCVHDCVSLLPSGINFLQDVPRTVVQTVWFVKPEQRPQCQSTWAQRDDVSNRSETLVSQGALFFNSKNKQKNKKTQNKSNDLEVSAITQDTWERSGPQGWLRPQGFCGVWWRKSHWGNNQNHEEKKRKKKIYITK